MLSLRSIRWFRNVVLPHGKKPVRSLTVPSLRVEALEDRLAPAAAPIFSHPPFPPVLPALERGLQAFLQRGAIEDLRLMLEDLKARKAVDPVRSATNPSSARLHLSNHPILAAFVASGGGSRLAGLGNGLLRTEWGNLMANPPAVPLGQGLTATTMILVHNESASQAGGPALSPGDPSSSPTRLPILAETPSSSPFNLQALMALGRDRAVVIELRPYSPAAPAIVPIPVPRGMDDWFAELFGAPAQGPSPGDALGSSNDSSEAVRDAVLQMLHQGETSPQWIGLLPPPVTGGTGDVSGLVPRGEAPQPPQPLEERLDGMNVRAPQLETRQFTQPDRQVGNQPRKLAGAKLTASSLLGLFAGGLGRAVWRQGRREQQRQADEDNVRTSRSPKRSLSL